ncbi:hypothetical protein H312_01560 [Anncaliia algerae PRA339]|uniref:Retrotransposon gag domain-containing protein n=1 Tax=Anncaliia algerae PRA339 TaxID=1288291 RepID=A0A059F160_9MICR|nr:hypothetical protein H312_01560 [Anncaliia algerae PRA339]
MGISNDQLRKKLDDASDLLVEDFIIQFEKEWDGWDESKKLQLIVAYLAGNVAKWFSVVRENVVTDVKSFISEYKGMFQIRADKNDSVKMKKKFEVLNRGLRPGKMEDDCWILFENQKGKKHQIRDRQRTICKKFDIRSSKKNRKRTQLKCWYRKLEQWMRSM